MNNEQSYTEPNECCGGYCPTFGTTCILDEPNQTTMNTNYTEQPFNLETALKHPEWVRTRDGKEVDFIREYPSAYTSYKIVAVLKNGDHASYNHEGFYTIGEQRNNDLILRVPYREVWVVLYEGRDAYWYNTQEAALKDSEKSNFIACVPVKIPAVC